MSEKSLTLTGFVKPHYIEELGCEGLTAREIAQSLGVQIESVHKKLRKAKWHNSPELKIIPYGILNKNNGITFGSFALETKAAKLFVVRWANNAGDGYFNYLEACERFIETKLPILEKQLKEMQKKIALLEKPKTQKQAGWIVTVTKVAQKIVDIFGEEHFEVQYEKKRIEDADPGQAHEARLKHAIRTQKGITDKVSDMMLGQQSRELAPGEAVLIPFSNKKAIKKRG